MTDRTPFDELDLRQALAGQAAAVQPVRDPARLRDGMARADRLRTVRAAATAGVMSLAVAAGVWNLQNVEENSLVDTVDRPEVEAPEPTLPAIDDAEDETAAVETVDTTSTTTTAAPVVEDDPDHLTPPPTTAAPISVTSSTVPPTTTAAPTTTTTNPPAPTTTAAPTTTTATIAFSASARYGTCEEDPPYDEYSGTAEPGRTITITSPYNSPVTVTADAAGDWFLRVEFPSAPKDETFTVTVSDGTASESFSFVHI